MAAWGTPKGGGISPRWFYFIAGAVWLVVLLRGWR